MWKVILALMSSVRRRVDGVHLLPCVAVGRLTVVGVVIRIVVENVVGLMRGKHWALDLVEDALHVELFPELGSPAPVFVTVLLVEAHEG